MIERNQIIAIILLFFLLLLLTGCSSEDEAEIAFYKGGGISKDAFDSYLKSEMEALNIPGLSVAVINEGKVVHRKNFGYANLAQKLPVTNQTIFEGASLSKSVFAFFVMTYVEAGKLDLDKPLYEYLPYPDIAYDERYKQITARMVLSHRSGFPNWREGKLKINFEPGTAYEYSGEGYQYLAMVLKHIEATNWHGLEAAFQEKVGQPLGLEHTVFMQTPYTRAHKAEPYDENGQWIDWKKDDCYEKGTCEFGAAYSIHSEPTDFSKWMIAVMYKQLLSEASYEELFTPHSKVQSGLVDASYGLGFFIPHFPWVYTDIYLHSGHNDGFTCWYALDTKKDWGFVLFTNSEHGEPLGEELFFYLLTGFTSTGIYVIGGVIVGILLLGLGYFIVFVIRKLKRKREYGVD